MLRGRTITLFAALSLVAVQAFAADYSFSGYGTLGYAQSNKSYAFQRSIDGGGTLQRDSMAGIQLDARFNSHFGATLQAKAAPSLGQDNAYAATLAWAFVSYRPTDDWLVRAGKLRVPLYLYSENTDIGATFDFARLPTEMYSISPTADFTGASFRKEWNLESGDLTLTGFWGGATTTNRFYRRDDSPDGIPEAKAGPFYIPFTVGAKGVALTLRRRADTFRLAFAKATARRVDGGQQFPRTFPFVPLAPGIGYYKTSTLIPDGVEFPVTETTDLTVIALGANVGIGSDLRVIAEYARRMVRNTEIGLDTHGGYVSLLKRMSDWTFYGTYAYLRSTPGPRNFYNAVNYNRVPPFIKDATLLNYTQRIGGDLVQAFDQSSWALGSSYTLTPTSKIKAEFQRVHIGQMSAMVDAPRGSDVRNQNINVYSLSYSFAF